MASLTRARMARPIPFDAVKLDRLMEEAGIDILLATSKHNAQYLLGAERAIFFDYMDALSIAGQLHFQTTEETATQILGMGDHSTGA